MSCRNFGGDLASIHSLKVFLPSFVHFSAIVQENSFVRRLAVSKGAVNGLFLGASVSGKGSSFAWIDGSDWDYDYFYPGNCNDGRAFVMIIFKDFPLEGQGECVAMDTLAPAGEWINKNCSASLAFACIRQRMFIIQTIWEIQIF